MCLLLHALEKIDALPSLHRKEKAALGSEQSAALQRKQGRRAMREVLCANASRG